MALGLPEIFYLMEQADRNTWHTFTNLKLTIAAVVYFYSANFFVLRLLLLLAGLKRASGAKRAAVEKRPLDEVGRSQFSGHRVRLGNARRPRSFWQPVEGVMARNPCASLICHFRVQG